MQFVMPARRLNNIVHLENIVVVKITLFRLTLSHANLAVPFIFEIFQILSIRLNGIIF